MSIDDAARFDPRIGAAVERVLLRGTRQSKLEYRADGSVAIRVYINTTDLWNELRQTAGW
jgi:hypothetical protein